MFGHIFLALNFRSENTPLIRQGILSNKVMLLWGVLAVVVLALGLYLPPLQAALQITSLQAIDWALVVGVAFVATFWMELKKFLTRKI